MKSTRPKTNLPLVSVVMPVYNAEKYLAQAIESIAHQSYRHLELIIVDDCSNDSSWQIISKYKLTYHKLIKTIRLKRNLNKGGDACANVGIAKAKGKFIARMDADDIAHPERIAKQIKYLLQHPDTLLVGSQAYVIDKEGKIIGNKQVPTMHQQIYNSYAVFHPLIHSTVMINTQLLPKRKQFYQIKYSANNDLYTFFKLLNKGKFANLPEKLLYYRVHGHNDSLTKPKERFFNTLKIRINAVLKDGYKPTIKAVITNLLQTVVILVLPESLIIPLYLYTKGITNMSWSYKPANKIPFSTSFSFSNTS